MIRTKINMDQERSIITNLIMDKEFAQKVLPILQPKYFKTRYAKVVSAWVRDYFSKYDDVPKASIQDIFLAQQSSLTDEEEMESVATFLQSISDEHEEKNSKYNVDSAIKCLKLRSLELHKEQIEESLAVHDPVKGEQTIANFTRVGLPEGDGADILGDAGKIRQAFNEVNEYVFTFPGALDKIIGRPMRGDLMAFLGKPKGQKSWALGFTAETAMSQGCNVVYFTLEMREPQMIRRAWQSMMALPRREGIFKIPYFAPGWKEDEAIEEDRKHWSIEYDVINKPAVMDVPIQSNLDSFKLSFGGGNCKYVFLPMYSATVEDIVAHLDNLYYYEGYEPDVVIVDYADIVKPSKSAGNEYRHQINDIWMKLRSIAQNRNILVVTASQTNRSGMVGDIELDNIAEDMRKIAHASILVALNQNKKEREAGVMRLNTLATRDETQSFDQAVVLQNLSIGRFYIDSQLGKQVDGMEAFKEDKK